MVDTIDCFLKSDNSELRTPNSELYWGLSQYHSAAQLPEVVPLRGIQNSKLFWSKGLSHFRLVDYFCRAAVVERAAATSKRTELEIALEILDRIPSIISQ